MAKDVCDVLEISNSRDALTRLDEDSKEARNKRIFEMWLACHTQEEIAEAVGCSQQTITDILPKMADLPNSVKPYTEHLIDFDIPIYNVWKFKKKLKVKNRPWAQ